MLIPLADMEEFEKIGFKRCKKPYNECYYLCFSRGIQMIFVSPVMVDIMDWSDNDPRIHENPNCRYRDARTALEFMCEMVKNKMVSCDYLERRKW
jgi:hypothetical protein